MGQGGIVTDAEHRKALPADPAVPAGASRGADSLQAGRTSA